MEIILLIGGLATGVGAFWHSVLRRESRRLDEAVRTRQRVDVGILSHNEVSVRWPD
jgi:hypothetical protein